MRLLIVGRGPDDKGRQLEILTTELLASLGYERIKTNVASDAGEVDVDAVQILPLPGQPKETKVIAECKAQKDPLNMTDWLKFLGKLHVARCHHPDVAGCLVALAGVNGNVLGSYESIKDRAGVRLVDSTVLTQYLANSHGLAARQKITTDLDASGRRFLSLDLAYYQRKVYWVVSYDDGHYTVLDADGAYPQSGTLDPLKPMIRAELQTGDFIDLREEARAQQTKALATNFVLSCGMLANGRTSIAQILNRLSEHPLQDNISERLIGEIIGELVANGTFVKSERDLVEFATEIEANLEQRRKFFVSFGSRPVQPDALGCEWWDSHIDGAFVKFVCETVQGGLTLAPEDEVKALKVIQLSPGALFYVLQPDPMIVRHRTQQPVAELTEDMVALDRSRFMRSLYSMLWADFKTGALAEYFHARRRIEAINLKTKWSVFDRDENEEISAEVSETDLIAEMDVPMPDGRPRLVHVATFDDFFKRRKAAQMGREKATGH